MCLTSNSTYSLLLYKKAISLSILNFLLKPCYEHLLVPFFFLIIKYVVNFLVLLHYLTYSSEKRGYSCLVPHLGGIVLSFSLLNLMLSVGISVDVNYQVKEVSLYP